MEQNVKDNVSELIGQDGLDQTTLGRLKSPSNKVVKVLPLLSNRHNECENMGLKLQSRRLIKMLSKKGFYSIKMSV